MDEGGETGMVCALHITHCMEEIEFRKADNAQRVAMIKAVYERCIEKEFRPYWKENWEKALPLVKELNGGPLACR